MNELLLIAPNEVGRLGGIALVALNHSSGEDRSPFTNALVDLTRAMRVDLGEPPLPEGVEPPMSETLGQAAAEPRP